MTRAKFICTEVSRSKLWDGSKRDLYSAKLQAVTSGSEDNQKFFAATPSGSIILSSFLVDAFEPGQEYYVDFTPAEENTVKI